MPHLSVMLKPASSACNMRCGYCFYHSLAASRTEYDYGIMGKETAENIIRKTLDFADGDSVYYSFQGGEPLLAGKEFFRFFTETVRRLNVKGAKIHYNAQTNGTLVDEEWTTLFREEKFLVGLSLDGDRQANVLRTDSRGRETFERVLDTADGFLNYGVEFNVLIVATSETARRAEDIYCFLRDRGYKYMQFIPVLRPPGGRGAEGGLYLDNETMFLLLDTLFGLYVKDFVRGSYVSVRQFDNWVRLFRGERSEQCGAAGHCTRQTVFEADGSCYPCDFYCIDSCRLGNVNESGMPDFFRSDISVGFIKESLAAEGRCVRCRYYFLCRGGGCKRSRADYDYCEAYAKFFGKNLPAFNVFRSPKIQKPYYS